MSAATDRTALLAAILAEPWDDFHRLAYADWLEEAGDGARAEFIRVQLRLEVADRVSARRRYDNATPAERRGYRREREAA